ncbi:MAG: UvrD-helicase domain-containing protein, partial [Christensenellaceae bacterium]|nr:UvrD-helicase domain-containing protein [Christensenellaceae bacterium]
GDVQGMTIATFHSMCARFLRRDADKIGYENNFTIYDTDDCKTLMKKVLSDLGIDNSLMTPQRCLSVVSRAKNAGAKESPEGYIADVCEGYADDMKAVYRRYCSRMAAENAMDFDDLLLNMLRVLEESPETRAYYTRKFKYVLVDEYQDTNSVQYALVKILSEGSGNIFVVGDDDQSIYAWRGADIRNILDFEKDYKNTRLIKLEQNYRSHSRILDAANAVISKAKERRGKTLWSAKNEGPKPKVYTAPNEYGEAEFIAREIDRLVREDKRYTDFAILYRMHTQARVLEEKLRTYGIPYQVYGGMSFFERKEIRDMVAYLTVLENPAADTALMRIVNTPKRGIGEVSLEKLRQYALSHDMSLVSAMEYAGEFMTGAAAGKFASFSQVYNDMLTATEGKGLGEMLEAVFSLSGYREMLMLQDGIEAETRMENIQELINSAYAFEKENEEATLADFLESISLISDMDTTAKEGSVTMMTLHSAKGLEFDTVFLAGMEENVFPSRRAIMEDKIDEERRLCYVGITRAKHTLYLTGCTTRNLFSSSSMNPPSRCLEDIPANMLEMLTPPSPVKRDRPAGGSTVRESFSFRPQVEFKPQVKADSGSFA